MIPLIPSAGHWFTLVSIVSFLNMDWTVTVFDLCARYGFHTLVGALYLHELGNLELSRYLSVHNTIIFQPLDLITIIIIVCFQYNSSRTTALVV